MLVTQSCLTLCDPVDYSPSGSSGHEILQSRILQWVALPSSRGSSWPRDWTWVSYIAGGFFTVWATREALCPSIHLLREIGSLDFGGWEVLRSTVSNLETQKNQWSKLQLGSKDLKTRGTNDVSASASPKAREDQWLSLETGKERILLVFCSVDAFSELEEGLPLIRKNNLSSLLGIPIHMLISPQNILTDTPRIMLN